MEIPGASCTIVGLLFYGSIDSMTPQQIQQLIATQMPDAEVDVSGDEGKFVVIDIETRAYEIDMDELAASDRLLARHPEAQVWMRRIGSRYVRRFGPRHRPSPA